jgi:ketosteroid isomerase-like protein
VNADYDNIAASYTDDAKIFPRNVDIITGQEKIRGYWVLPEGVKTTHHKVTSLEIKVIGDEAYDYGYYEGRSSTAEGESSWRGKYVIVWKKTDGVWKMYLDIWNSIR